MMLNRDYLGHISEQRVVNIEKGQIQLFAKSIGETDPVYFDEVAARTAGYSGIPAPLTFASCLRFLVPSKTPTMEELGLDYSRLLHAEEQCEYLLPIHAGDKLTLVTEVVDMYEKKDGALEFLVREMRISNESNSIVQKVVYTVVMKNRSS